ncbi:6412_t:CDS:2, partial [Ambispora leptoticha]
MTDISLKVEDVAEKDDISTTSGGIESVSLAWQDLTYTITDPKLKVKHHIIEGVSGFVKPGEVMA